MPSDSDDEDLVTFGTPLEPLNEDEVPKKKPFTLEDQVVKDKQGRRRFHGAFTGGFSAGFFNSVGSLEGWTPSQFKSSRSDKAQTHKQKAEDFMDEEDMDEFGIAPKSLQTTSDYSSERKRTNKRQMRYHDGPIPGDPVLRDILQPVRETVGMKILIKMGWKPGQGVGPRLSKAEKQRTQNKNKRTGAKIYGCSLSDQLEKEHVTRSDGDDDDDDEEEEEEDEYRNITFAPDDYEPYIVKPKDNYFGIGYSGLDRKSILSNHVDLFGPSLVMKDKNKKLSIRGQAFGVGALEDEDEDIYAKEDKSQYDFALESSSTLAERRRQEQKSSRIALTAPPLQSGPLEGFIQASVTTIRKKFFRPPQLPHTFEPQHKVRKSRFEDKPVVGKRESKKGVYGYNLTANERAILVNEESSDKMELKNTVPTKTTPNTEGEWAVERTPCGSFKPFAADIDKQERYEKYLSLKKLGQTEKLKSLQPLNMTEWECEREKSEFEQASRLFKPLSVEFSDRFVSASQPDDATDPLVAVQRTTDANSEMISAAKMKMFGSLTREILDWTPSSLVYKRFNIAEPGTRSGASNTDQKRTRPKFSVFNFLESAPFNIHASARTQEDSSKETDSSSSTSVKPDNTTIVEAVTEAEAQNDSNLDLVPENAPKIDLYRAIFLSSSEDESENEKEDPKSDSESGTKIRNDSESAKQPSTDVSLKTGLQQPETSEVNVLRNTSPPRGVFANLDLDAINSRCMKKTEPNENLINKTVTETDRSKIIAESEKMETAVENKNETDLVYGPCLPSVFLGTNTLPRTTKKSQSSSDSDSDSEWVELKAETKHKHKKKHSKKPHKKDKRHRDVKKHKHKKKKK